MRNLPPEPKRREKTGLCPFIEECDIPMEEKDFKENCLKDYMNCFMNSSKYPYEWYEEYKKKGRVK